MRLLLRRRGWRSLTCSFATASHGVGRGRNCLSRRVQRLKRLLMMITMTMAMTMMMMMMMATTMMLQMTSMMTMMTMGMVVVTTRRRNRSLI